MNPQLIIIVLSFILIWLVFKLVYQDKNPFRMIRFWLLQIVVTFIWFRIGRDVEVLVPYLFSFLIVLILFKVFNRGKNPFRMISFWILQIITVVVITIIGFVLIFRAYGKGHSYQNNLVNSIDLETIKGITIIQRKDTVHIDEVMPFLVKLEEVEKSSGPVKYPVSGKIIFIRTDGSKDSINTNGYGYGPYKGKWYQSEKNVLEEYIKRK